MGAGTDDLSMRMRESAPAEIRPQPRAGVRVARFIRKPLVIAVLAASIGAGTGLLRKLHDNWPDNYVNVAYFLALPALCAAICISRPRLPAKRTLGRIHFLLVVLCIGFVMGWLAVEWDALLLEGIVFLTFLFWLVAAPMVTVAVLTPEHLWKQPRGPFCPDCSYHLVGLSRDVCPECGRPFTLAELGITRADLAVPGVYGD